MLARQLPVLDTSVAVVIQNQLVRAELHLSERNFIVLLPAVVRLATLPGRA